jgi:hypothetical protein
MSPEPFRSKPAERMPMPDRMQAGVWALRILTGCVVLLACLNLAVMKGILRSTLGYDELFSFFALVGMLPLLVFLFVCLSGISHGHRIAAILALLAPVFLSLPLVTELLLVFLGGSGTGDLFIYGIILFRILMLAVLIAAWPLAFGEMARTWYRHCKWVEKENRQWSAANKIRSLK